MSINLSRRVSLVAAGGFAASLASCATTSRETETKAQEARRNIVLVHGAWHGGWCWIRVRDALEARGHRVYTPTLTGLADKQHLLRPDTDLQTHVTDIVNLIKFESLNNVVLVGHSYGGVVISQVVEQIPDTVNSLVFVDAYMPENGRSLLDDASPALRRSMEESARNSGGLNAVKPISAEFFRVNLADRAMVDAKCTPQPYKTFVDKASISGARERIARKAYLRASQYPSATFDSFYEKRSADPSWQTAKVASGHDMMLDAPAELTNYLLRFSGLTA